MLASGLTVFLLVVLLLQVQFCLAFLHSMQLFFYDCGFPKWITICTMPNAMFFYFLFTDFYKKAYKPPIKCKTENVEKLHQMKILNMNDNNNVYVNGHNVAPTNIFNSHNGVCCEHRSKED